MPILLLLTTRLLMMVIFFFFNDTATTEIYTLSLHDALPICLFRAILRRHGGLRSLYNPGMHRRSFVQTALAAGVIGRSEEHTSELQSHLNLVCRLLLEKKNILFFGSHYPPDLVVHVCFSRCP